MKREQPVIRTTDDGSKTLYLNNLNEPYHSLYGAVSESRHIFLEAGFSTMVDKACSITIFEMGFGTGLNAFLTFLEARKRKKGKVHYVAVEAWPIEEDLFTRLDYPAFVNDQDAADIFLKMHTCPWDIPYFISDQFVLNKIHSPFEELTLKELSFDLVYYDAFAPDLQPELWSEAVFEKLFRAMRPGGILVTYSARGAVKRAMQMAGFVVEALPGPAGKREISRALRPAVHHHSH
ncbi:MAG: SAM-dependent methyltransferase [Bacteroidia bacterium]|nr:tRNA (5-methylaminomethyl-2-thiouridine)(34)-methyltransferase MnmD [Bacteroidales bacterium]MDD3960972.1 tRNA (5-methylaminomethyl-2-thiouridine)(34)-methyltransferase MnmD [Bacteroidales bacterium]NCD43031.1 SAM-dependent methyltransferase [Bacteroidia bacterium]